MGDRSIYWSATVSLDGQQVLVIERAKLSNVDADKPERTAIRAAALTLLSILDANIDDVKEGR